MSRQENKEVASLLEAVYRKYGYDFRDYGAAHLKRRIKRRMQLSNFSSITELHERIVADEKVFERLFLDLSINVTEMFRDPFFYRDVRQEVVPLLKTYPFVKIWHAGCATGEEVYSMAILLKEEGLYDKCQIYATDFNRNVLARAREGIYPVENIKAYTANYQAAGGRLSFADYYVSRYDSVIMESSLKERIVFADHNLSTDFVFGEMNLIVCRNVLIYFNNKLRDRVVGLFLDSLCPGGILCLGSKESLKYSSHAKAWNLWQARSRIYRRKYRS